MKLTYGWVVCVGALVACGDDEKSDPCADDKLFDPSGETLVLELVNQARQTARTCGANGTFAAASSLTFNATLGCAARNHSQDMGQRNYTSHTSPDGDGPAERVEALGYRYSWLGENIAWGAATPQQVMDLWLQSDGHCANIMSPNATELGVGHYENSDTQWDHYWTQVFGRP